MKESLVIITIFFFLLGCKKNSNFKDDDLSIQKIDYDSHELKIDGYYSNIWGDPESLTFYFFCRNGILSGDLSPLKSELEKQELDFIDGSYYNLIKDVKYYWGVFQIEENRIRFEKWYPSEGFLKSYVRAGLIINDSTFQITESYRMKDGKKTEWDSENEIYNFRKFSPKPDSTNSFTN